MDMAKLVRDRIPEIIVNNKGKAITHIADGEEYWDKLRLKFQEEVDEVLEAETDEEIKEEIADVLEVINAICKFKNTSIEEVESLRLKKALDRGIFDKRIILDNVE